MRFPQNLKFLRKANNYSLDELAEQLGVTRQTLSKYEKGEAVPSLGTVINAAKLFDVSLDQLSNRDLSDPSVRTAAQTVLRTEEADNFPWNMILVDVKASAGYTDHINDIQFFDELEKFYVPWLDKSKVYRGFEIDGDSMLPIPSGSVVIGEQVPLAHFYYLRDGEMCILATDEGILFKKVEILKDQGAVRLVSLNPSYKPYELKVDAIKEAWRYTCFMSKDLPYN